MTQMSTSYNSLWEIGTIDIDGHVINQLKDLVAGKKAVLVVNVASLSHHASENYEALVDLYQRYEDKGLEILAFPCN